MERVIEVERVGKLGTVTDLASVSLRSISARVDTQHHKLQHTPSYLLVLETLLSQDWMLISYSAANIHLKKAQLKNLIKNIYEK